MPTYNNAKTLKTVIESVLAYTNYLFVINDGSTDATSSVLEEFGNKITTVEYSPNRGKGLALVEGFQQAYAKGFKFAVTIDSDGQHLASDLPNFIKKLEEEPGSLIVGSRNMDQEHIPGGSTFGHKFSNFWYRVETGVSLPDTQSGYRLYPLEYMVKTKFFTTKYEFEIENIVRASWKGINVTSVLVEVIYQTGDDRVSHFRSWDFVRTALLNTVLVTLAFTIYLPHRIIHLFKKKT
jgi:glycosyltransferase involved in cell wall biosynthesis